MEIAYILGSAQLGAECTEIQFIYHNTKFSLIFSIRCSFALVEVFNFLLCFFLYFH